MEYKRQTKGAPTLHMSYLSEFSHRHGNLENAAFISSSHNPWLGRKFYYQGHSGKWVTRRQTAAFTMHFHLSLLLTLLLILIIPNSSHSAIYQLPAGFVFLPTQPCMVKTTTGKVNMQITNREQILVIQSVNHFVRIFIHLNLVLSFFVDYKEPQKQ